MDTWTLTGTQQWYAKEGLIQVAMDHRASGHFGKEGVNYMYHNLGYWEIKDYSTMAKWLIANGNADSTKICITGFSYGGYMSCLALTYGAEVFTHGMAGGSVTDWSLYDTHYTERYMGTLADNADGYKNSSPLTYADKYKGMLQIVHGVIDDNVHMQNSLQLVAKLEDLKKDFDQIKKEIFDENVPDDFDLESAKVRLDELRAKIDALGPVNMMALQELTEIEERFEFLNTQKTDIESAIADTQAAIAEIKKRSRERFTETFYAVNENFKTMFVELFGGGQAEMRLIDETDVLESGIEIIAQPPGKRLQNVLLLSGGEKAMTAMALVLGIFKYRPSPFCLLDEVDAPLDETNIGRFSDKILEMSNNTQFMVITHSKRTMEAAKTLYGVTMEDPGISKLISVKLS